MFEMFGKKKPTIYDEIKDFESYKKSITLIEKSKNLLKLGRKSEAAQLMEEVEQIAVNSVKKSPNSLQANLLLAFVYKEILAYDYAEKVLQNILNSNSFSLKDEDKLALKAELQIINREKNISDNGKKGTSDEVTSVFSCQNCGRIINYVTIPCPHCQWYPRDVLSLSRSIFLSNSNIEIHNLILLAREVSSGRQPTEVVRNLNEQATKYYKMDEKDTHLKMMFDLLQKNANMNARDINMLRECQSCGNRIPSSQLTSCNSCGEVVVWPESIKLIVCMDSLMWLIEQKVKISKSSEFAQLVCLLTLMFDKLFRKQETPSLNQRNYALRLLQGMKAISDSDGGAAIDTSNLNSLKIYIDSSRPKNLVEDSTQFGLFIYSELEYFVKTMTNGIRL